MVNLFGAVVIMSAVAFGLINAAPPNPWNKEILSAISEQHPFMDLVGTYLDPVTLILKRYYTDGIARTWQQCKDYCLSLSMEPASPLTDAETEYITKRSAITSDYYWTSGRQGHSWVWELNTGLPVYNSPNWCTQPAVPLCIVLHKGLNLHGLGCTTLQQTLCQLKL